MYQHLNSIKLEIYINEQLFKDKEGKLNKRKFTTKLKKKEGNQIFPLKVLEKYFGSID